MEVSRAQVVDHPRRGRDCFAAVIRDTLDLGRPDRIQRLVDGRGSGPIPPVDSGHESSPRGIVPSLHVEYKRCHLKQSWKEGRAVRTETIFNDTYDSGIGRGLSHFAYLRTLGAA